MTREEASQHVQERVKTKNLWKHMLAVEAVMRRLAKEFGEDPEMWGLAGLVHDIDYDETANDPARHSIVGAELLAQLGYPPEVVQAVKVHNDYHGFPRVTRMEKALYATDPLTGLIVAAALIHPDKKLASLDTGFVLNRFYEKSFAKGARRETIQTCSELGLTLEKFISLGLEAMQGIAGELGL